MHRVLLLAASFALASSLSAQQHLTGGNEGKRPLGWQVRYDAGEHAAHGADSVSFTQMTPGFHVTTGGSAAIMWHADSTAGGDFAVESTIFLFPTKGRDREGYGLLVGGADLAGAGQRYTYFLLRNDGKFLVKQRTGAQTRTLTDWTALAAIALQSGPEAVKNVLRVEAKGATVRFLVNGTEAVVLPRAQASPDGVFGVRMNHAVNAHVSSVARAK
jgi:opacity protein-like surface antigen